MVDNLAGRALPLSADDFARISEGHDPLALWAVVTVETRGAGFLQSRRPKILFERHYFHRITDGRFDARAPSISSRSAGGYIGGNGEYPRFIQASLLDQDAAIRSTSWGLGQIMGDHYQRVGFDTPVAMWEAMKDSEANQLLAMVRFIDAGRLRLRFKTLEDAAAFARSYNGPKYRENAYDTKLLRAYQGLDEEKLAWALRIRRVQVLLSYLPEFKSIAVDGQWGRGTAAALVHFLGASPDATQEQLLSDAEGRLA